MWPSFRWQDKQFPAPNATTYRNWGTLKVPLEDGTSLAYSEPNRWAHALQHYGCVQDWVNCGAGSASWLRLADSPAF